ncbi:fumarylacetoacetate hydrolase family protein [Bradyrhizobium jicamae]|uniref:fumarylacetoacetate hydrolase family protein n=1 Tax=Bradyrhizobium jicamae TaxID=280332 RepID=UPI001BAA2889|nr:fumarylacetoacetate hydrolase family protein [Bradyrhizobium jicamae]MBR0754351.1 fumarylacetoacetate hydrolase family protein [Bradyrhizobium jicamae]
MHLVTFQSGELAVPGAIVEDEILHVEKAAGLLDVVGLPTSLKLILEQGETALDLVRRLIDKALGSAAHRMREEGALVARASARLSAPIPDTSFILCGGANYRQHLQEMKVEVPHQPLSFVKNATSVIGDGAPIVLPPSNPGMVDWEGEFSAVIGRPCHRVNAADALDYVAGYTLINDVSARDWVAPVFDAPGIMGPIYAWERNILGKQFPTFCPMGPVLVTRDEIRDPDNVDITTTVNGEVMQSANTSDLIFNVADMIAYYSQFYRLCPGDVITTGSPAGVGYGRTPQKFLKAGDVVSVHATGVGALTNPVV